MRFIDRLKTIARRLLPGEKRPDMWRRERGSDYKTFWTSMSETPEEALLATYGKEASDEERLACCQYIADYIVDALEIDGTKQVLEVGCGLGLFSRLVGPKCGRYVGTDISPHMVERSRAFVEEEANLEFQVLPRSDLSEFKDATFDAVFFEAVLMHLALEDAFNYLCEAHRVLKPSGRVYASFQNLLQAEGFQHFLRIASEADRTGLHGVGRVRFHTGPIIRKLAWGAGFEVEERHARLEIEKNDPERHEARTLTLVATKSTRPEWKTTADWPF